jgi:hypothetical protein
MSDDAGVPDVRLTVTLPPSPSEVGAALRSEHPELIETTDVFRHVALQAAKRLVFVVPFFDLRGGATLADLYLLSRATEKILICRDTADVRGAGGTLEADLVRAGVQVRTYKVHHARADGGVTIETFHAKIALADAACAYVGSANAMRSSLETTMECGVLLRGVAVSQVKSLVDVLLLHC